MAGRCRPGDVLALVEGEVNLIGSDLADTCADRARPDAGGGGELVTLLAGADAPGRAGRGGPRARRAGAGRSSRCRRTTGGQPHYPLLVGVE